MRITGSDEVLSRQREQIDQLAALVDAMRDAIASRDCDALVRRTAAANERLRQLAHELRKGPATSPAIAQPLAASAQRLLQSVSVLHRVLQRSMRTVDSLLRVYRRGATYDTAGGAAKQPAHPGTLACRA